MKKQIFILTILLFTLFVFTQPVVATERYEKVQTYYRHYLDLVDKKADKNLIQEALERYRGEYQTYLDNLAGGEQLFSTDSTTPDALRASAATASKQAPVVQKRLSTQLLTKKSKLQKIVERLEAALVNVKDPEVECQLCLELSFLYQEFKKDNDKAEELLARVMKHVNAGTVDGKIAEQAKTAMNRLQAKQYVSTLSDEIIQKRNAADQARANFTDTRFLANPIKKVTALFSYWKKRGSYRITTAKMREFKYEKEANGTFALDQTGLSFIFDNERFDFDCSDVFDAISVVEEANQAYCELITDNMQAWYARWKILNEARYSIDLTYYIIEPDIFGMSLMGVLLKKAKEGVNIRMMIDAHGTKNFANKLMGQDYLQELCQYPNVKIKVFNPIHRAIPRLWQNIRTLISSNHDKIIVVDHEWVITGGRNISVNYFADPRDNSTVYRDTDVIVRSSALGEQMYIAFTEEFDGLYNKAVSKDLFGNWDSKEEEITWAWRAMNRHIHGDGLFSAEEGCPEAYIEELATYNLLKHYSDYRPFRDNYVYPVKILDKHSFNDARNDITENIIRFIDASREEIIIQNPYVVLTDSVFAALKRADSRGVKIIFHTNSPVSTDSVLTQAFFMNDWKRVLVEMPLSRIHVFVGKNKLHAKVFVFDKEIGVVGTYNMDPMSEELNSEVVAAVHSTIFAGQVRDSIMKDIAVSDEYKVEVLADGTVRTIKGPSDITPKKTMVILNLLRKFKILKPII